MDEPTVLVVDDSPTVRKIVQMTLQREHIRVITAGDGLSALTSVADEMPAVILARYPASSYGWVPYLPDNTKKLAVSANTYYYAQWERWLV